jgi:hypothetical protein
VSNAIQGEPWKRQKQLTRAFERISEPELSEKTSKPWTYFAVKLKKRTSKSLHSTERVAAMRLPCRNFDLRYLRAEKTELRYHTASQLGQLLRELREDRRSYFGHLTSYEISQRTKVMRR